MRTFKGIFLILAAIALTLSCAKKEEGTHDAGTATLQEAKYSNFMKNWTSDACIASKIIPISQTHYKIEYDLHGDSFVKRYNYYTDAACNTQVALITYAGTLSLSDSTNEDKLNSKHLDTKFSKATVTATNAEGSKFLQLVDLCGQKDFPVGKEIDMTDMSQKALCILQTSNGVTYYDRGFVENNTLRTATGYSEKPTNKDSNARPNIDDGNNERFITR